MSVSITYSGATPTVGGDEDTWGTEANAAFAAVKVDLDALATLANENETDIAALQAASGAVVSVRTGSIIIWPSTTIPSGYLACNGAAVSRSTYSALFTAISTTFGVGDGSTTFNLPDLRGEFVRGFDDGRGVDSGRAFASAQADELESHTHTVAASQDDAPNTAIASGSGTTSAFVTTSATGGTETRPRNIALWHIIKT